MCASLSYRTTCGATLKKSAKSVRPKATGCGQRAKMPEPRVYSKWRTTFLFTSESVSEGHPDKVADRSLTPFLDAIFEQDPKAVLLPRR